MALGTPDFLPGELISMLRGASHSLCTYVQATAGRQSVRMNRVRTMIELHTIELRCLSNHPLLYAYHGHATMLQQEYCSESITSWDITPGNFGVCPRTVTNG